MSKALLFCWYENKIDNWMSVVIIEHNFLHVIKTRSC
jgi:hypothetical protein